MNIKRLRKEVEKLGAYRLLDLQDSIDLTRIIDDYILLKSRFKAIEKLEKVTMADDIDMIVMLKKDYKEYMKKAKKVKWPEGTKTIKIPHKKKRGKNE